MMGPDIKGREEAKLLRLPQSKFVTRELKAAVARKRWLDNNGRPEKQTRN